MANTKQMTEAVQQVVADVLNRSLTHVSEEITRRIADEISVPADTNGRPTAELLRDAINRVQGSTAQVDILDALLEGCASFSARSAIFVVRGNTAAGWQARGFQDNEVIRNTPLELNSGLAAQAITNRASVSGRMEQFYGNAGVKFGWPARDEVVVLPLVVRDRCVALLYADGGDPAGKLDSVALDVLVRTTGLWLEICANRRSAVPTTAEAGTGIASAAPAVMAAAAGASQASVSIHAAAASSVSSHANGEDELHKKARRFAKLLVEEIKLYNQAKVNEGKANHDLYERLRDDIEKSRETYDKRYGQTPAGAADLFNQELVRILADNNPALLGSAFPR
ncbi:MAG TPA: hypothetical protein VKW78_13950 [Terriglobales bacterium]|nr:hypothetical protein [Terriglobales bacterium]